MVDADELLPWEVLPEGLPAQPPSAPAQSWPARSIKKLPRLEAQSPGSSQGSTPRGAGALFDFKELEHSTAPAGHGAKGTAAAGTSQADADGSVDCQQESLNSWENVVLHPEGLQCLVVCTDWVSVFAAPSEDRTRIGTLKEGSLVTVYEVRDNWACHNFETKRGKVVSAWSTMFDPEETCLIRPLSELTDEERWIFGDFSALALPEPKADAGDTKGAAAPRGAAEAGAEEAAPDQAKELEAQQQDTDPPEDGPSSSAAPASGDPPKALELEDLLGLFGQQPDPRQPLDAQKRDGERGGAGADADPDTVAFANILPDGLQCVVVCRSWVPVRLAPTYWSKMIGGLKVGSHVTVYEYAVAGGKWARHEFAMRDGVRIPAWSSVVDPHHGKLLRPLANVSASDLERLQRLRAGPGSSPAAASEPDAGPLVDHRLAAGVGGPLLLEVLGLGLTALGTVLHAGPAAARALRAASRDVGSSVAELVPLVQRWCPISLYVCGGYTSTQEDSSSGIVAASHSVERLHPVTGTWEALPRMLQRRAGAAAATVAGRVYVCGGSDGRVELRTAERFDPLGGAWEPIAHMLQRRECAAAANVSNKLYVCGGSRSSLRGAMIEETAERFDPEADAWESVPSMLEKRVGAAAASLGGLLYVCGGMEGADDLRSVERLEPVSPAPAWELLPPMRHTRYGAAAASVAGKLYVCGGTVQAVAAATVECFDPATRIWKESPPMIASRNCTAAASIAGRLYVMGGKAGRHCLDAAELFDPVARTWKAIAPMLQGRRGVAAAAAGGPLHLRLRLGAADELTEEQQRVARMWEDYNERAASHLQENAF